MDPIGAVTSLCSLTKSLLIWIDELKEKEEALSSLSATAERIHAILARFEKVEIIEPTLLNAFLGLGDMLKRTQEHLIVWSSKKKKLSFTSALGFAAPARITGKLVQDEQQLANQLVLILFAMSSISFLRDDTPTRVAERQDEDNIAQFWGDFISFARTERFSESLALYFGSKVNESDRSRLILNLDEFHVGGVSRCNLQRFVGNKSLDKAVESFLEISEAPIAKDAEHTEEFEQTLLIWIDDEIENIQFGIDFAKEHNVVVVHFASTAMAKAWVEENADVLRIADRLKRVRVISDNVRFEADNIKDDAFLNIAAGENILRYLRGHGFDAPVLIYCGSSLQHTNYVTTYTAAGSTTFVDVLERYIVGLAEGKEDEEDWKGFDRVPYNYHG